MPWKKTLTSVLMVVALCCLAFPRAAAAAEEKISNDLTATVEVKDVTPPGGGGGGPGSAVSPPVQPPAAPPGAVEPITDEVLEEALTRARETGRVVIQAPEDAGEVGLQTGQVDRLVEAGLPVVIDFRVAAFELPPEVLEAPLEAVPDVVQVQVRAHSLTPEAARDLSDKAAGTPVYAPAAPIIDLAILGVTAEGEQVYVRTFTKPVRISLPVPADLVEQAEKGLLVVGRLNEVVMRWEEVSSWYDPQKGTMVWEAYRLSLYTLLERKDPPLRSFADTAGHWAQKDVETMAGLGIARGVGGDKFNPNASITRAEFLAFLIRTLNLGEKTDVGPHFADVSRDSWYYGVVETAYGAGLASGYGDGTFKPERPVTREEIAAWLDRAAAYAEHGIDAAGEVEALLGAFSDSHAVSTWARESVAGALKAGVLRGRTEGKLDPLAAATRAEALVMLKRLLVYMKQLPE
ncbi:S-layer homology domain-containing protein [Moorellaceae bacterium AZ2]